MKSPPRYTSEVCPYDPQSPASPEVFAGRKELLAKTAEFVERAQRIGRGGGLLLLGHRGSGKTSAIRKIGAEVRAAIPKALIVEIPLNAVTTEATFMAQLVEEVLSAASREPGRDGLVSSLVKGLGRIEFNILGVGAAVESKAKRATPVNPIALWKQCAYSLAEVPLLCLCVDDAECLDNAGLGALKTIRETESAVPILLVATAVEGTASRLASHQHSPVARVFSGATFNLSAFSLAETEEALAAPLRLALSSTKWTREGVEAVQSLTGGYPYLVQCLASTAFRPGATLARSDVEAGVVPFLDVAEGWLEGEWKKASEIDVRSFLKIVEMNRSRFSAAQMSAAGINPGYVRRLQDQGLIERVAYGVYRLGKPPAVGLYQAQRRGITVVSSQARLQREETKP